MSVRYFAIDYSNFLSTLVLGCHRDTWVYIQVVLGYQIDTWVLFSRQNCRLMSRNVKKMHFFLIFFVIF